MIKALFLEDFDETLQRCQKPALVNFAADWCPDCRRFQPIISKVSDEYADSFDFFSVDTADQRALAARYNIRLIPTVILFQNGKAVRRDDDAGTLTALMDFIRGARG